MSAPTELRCNTCGRPAAAADRFCGFCGARLDGENATPADTTGSHGPHVDRILSSLRGATIGEYDIAGELGRGGMAVVFLAHDLSLNRKVAIKALLPELLYTEGMDRRFKHEARIAAKLDHPNILVIHSVREANDLLYIVMKLVEGLPLSQIVKVAGPLPVPVVRTVVRHVADALAYAHGEGVVHRDVKPANIMVDRRGNVVVMDFGIAKAADDAHLTRTGLVIGTPAYMSPEQCLAQAVTSASDQYSLGVVAYELLTGKTPFRGSPLEMQWAHATSAPPTVRALRPDCPPDLEAVVLRMMAKAPADRWPTLLDVSHALTDEPSVVSAARGTLVTLVSEVPGRRDATLPTTPASPVPIGPGPAAAGNATTDPVRATMAPREPNTPLPANSSPAVGAGSVPNAAPLEAAAATPPPAVAAPAPMLTLSRQQIDLRAGDAVELVVELEAGDDPTDGSSVEWRSSNPAVAKISADGIVTALGPGLAEIACVWRGRRAVCVVHVAAAPAVAAVAAAEQAIAALARKTEARRPTSPDVAPAPAVPTPVRNPSPAPSRWASSRWLAAVVAAGIIGVVAFRAMRPTSSASVPAPAMGVAQTAPVPTPPPATPSPTSSPNATSSATAGALSVAAAALPPRPAAPKPPAPNVAQQQTGRSGSASTAAARPTAAAPIDARPASSTASTPPTRTGTTATTATVPIVPLARPESTRLTSRVDSGAGYGAPRPGTPASTPANTPPATPAPAPPRESPATPARDSAADRIPPAPKDIAAALFKEFANAVNGQAFSRILGAYTQPADPAGAKLMQDFLVFVRDYRPTAVVRSTSVNESVYPATITATIDFRWATDAGFDRSRSATFVGIGVPISNGWQLHRVQLAKKFW